MKATIRKWIRYFFCEHDWQPKCEFEHFVGLGAEKRTTGITYAKECTKCHRIWAQRIP